MKEEEIAETHGRRRQPRMCCQPTIVHVHLKGYERPLNAQMIEVSKGGMQLQVNESLPVGALLTIDTGVLTVHGEIRHCQPQPDYVFLIGVQKRDDPEESPPTPGFAGLETHH